jgi:glycosyltransferase involved in cell wall biosynthesis
LNQPLVSVVAPFRNTAPYLRQCLDSILAQNYKEFECILSDNCSSDRSGEIAEEYARKDSRIRFIRQPSLLSQGDHYNSVLKHISDVSTYCKIVQADDFIFPDCLRLMVQAFAQSDSIGLVSSYYLKGAMVRGSGFPPNKRLLPGKEMARLFLRKGIFVFGSETTVMYRSSLIRSEAAFFDGSLLHADTEKCLQILEHWDFGFVHQVLSFLRMDNVNASISAEVHRLQPEALDWYITAQRYAGRFLEQGEAKALIRESRREYYQVLAHEALHLRNAAFWRYHRKGLKTLGQTIDYPYLCLQTAKALLWMVLNPGETIAKASRLWKPDSTKTRSGAEPLLDHTQDEDHSYCLHI